MYEGGAFGAFACHGRHVMRAVAQAACRQPAQLNAPLVVHVSVPLEAQTTLTTGRSLTIKHL